MYEALVGPRDSLGELYNCTKPWEIRKCRSREHRVSCTLYEAPVNPISAPDKADQIRVYLLEAGPYGSQAHFAL